MTGAGVHSLDRAVADANRLNLEFELRPSGAHDDLSEAAAELGLALPDVVKTMVLRADDVFLIVLVPGDRTLSWRKLRAVLGVNRITIARGDVAAERTGYPKGGISVLGLDGSLAVLADTRLLGRRIGIRAGTRAHSMLIDADALLDAVDAAIHDLSDARTARTSGSADTVQPTEVFGNI